MASVSEFLQPLETVINFEANYSLKEAYVVFDKAWFVPLLACALYLTLVWRGKKLMQKRTPFGLRAPLFVWNLCLAIFSIAGAAVEFPPLVQTVRKHGFTYSVCHSDILFEPAQSLFALLFVISKIVEFGDTFFVVMRKTPLNVLHWYHHITVCVFSWHSLATQSAPAHWFCAMNYVVHSVMYSYYVLKSTGLRMPSAISKTVTMLQLVQFLVGFVVVATSTWLCLNGVPCKTNILNSFLGLFIYASYLVLFSNFFYQRFVKVKSDRKKIQ